MATSPNFGADGIPPSQPPPGRTYCLDSPLPSPEGKALRFWGCHLRSDTHKQAAASTAARRTAPAACLGILPRQSRGGDAGSTAEPWRVPIALCRCRGRELGCWLGLRVLACWVSQGAGKQSGAGGTTPAPAIVSCLVLQGSSTGSRCWKSHGKGGRDVSQLRPGWKWREMEVEAEFLRAVETVIKSSSPGVR